MARPAGANAELTRSRILDSASTHFAQLGLGGVSVRDIARGAGVSLGMVHHYFGSKDELYQACVDSMYEELHGMRAELLSRLKGADSVSELIDDAVRVSFHFAREHQTSIRLLMRTVVEHGELGPVQQRALQLPFLEEISGALGDATGRSITELRLATQSVTFLVSRYALSSDHELRVLTGMHKGSFKAVLAEVESHLAGAALSLLDLPRISEQALD
ncbi:MAG: TetR family transcriptional regulator [Myxococcales bacterium]|nr:TetR family transcriptional regulator [Myxococcales bacterium]